MERREKNGRTDSSPICACQQAIRLKKAQLGRRTLQKVARLRSLPRRSGWWLAPAALDGPPFSAILRQERALIPACS